MLHKVKFVFMWYKIRELNQSKLSKSRIALELGINRATVRKFLIMSEEDFLNRVEKGRNLPKKLSSYLNYVRDELQRHPYLSAAQIEDRLKEHYQDLPQVHSKTVYNFVQLVRQQFEIKKPKSDSLRDFEQVPPVDYGKEAQVDFGEYYMQTESTLRIKVYFFLMVLSRSRFKFVYFQETQFTAQDAIYAHLLAFEYMQGIPWTILYDQDSVFLRDENLGDYIFTHRFGAFINSQPCKAIFCRKSDPQTKGKVENAVGYVKKNFLRGRLFKSISQLNQEALAWLSRTANAKVHSATRRIPSAEWEIEKGYLHTVNEKAVKPDVDFTTYNVRKDNTVAFKGNFYTLPTGTYQGSKTTVLLSEVDGQLNIYSMDHKMVGTHAVSPGKGELVRNTDHKRDKSGNILEHQEQAHHLLGSSESATLFLDMLKKDKPRYYHDNLRAIIKGTQGIPIEFVRQSLSFCIENGLFNGARLSEVAANYQKLNRQSTSLKINIEVSETNILNEATHMDVQTSNIKTYENLIVSWNR